MSKQPCAICNKKPKTRAVRCRHCGRRVCKSCGSFGWCLECDDKTQTVKGIGFLLEAAKPKRRKG